MFFIFINKNNQITKIRQMSIISQQTRYVTTP